MKQFFLYIFLSVCILIIGGGLLLKKGLHLESFSTGSVTLSNVTLKWQDKLELQVENLAIDLPQSQDTRGKKSPDLTIVEKLIPLTQWMDRLFASIGIQGIKIGEMSGALLYEASLCHLNFSSNYFNVYAIFHLGGTILNAEIEELRSEQFHSHASGELQFNIADKTGSGQLTANLADSLPIILEFTTDSRQLSFQGKENGRITTITPFVDLFGLDRDIQRWITKYLQGSRYELKSFKGNFPWNNPSHLLESFTAEVRVENCEYTFAPGLEPIKTSYTDVDFKKGVLGIVPHDATFYGQDGVDSWLDINFNDVDNILLTAYILTSAVGNADIINLLKYYDVSLPFVQVAGKTKTDLTLAINLNKTEVTADGHFQIDDGVIEYENKPYRVKDAEITLQNSHISIEKLRVGFEKMFEADLSGTFDGATGRGDIDIVVQDLQIPVGNSLLQLAKSGSKPQLQYQIRPEGCRVNAGKSSWTAGAFFVHLGAFKTPFSFADLSGNLPSTPLSVQMQFEETTLAGEIGGPFSLKEQKIDLQCSIEKYSGGDLLLESRNTPIHINYDNGLTIQNLQVVQWSINQVPVTLLPSRFSFKDNMLSIRSDKVIYGDFFEGGIRGSYDLALAKGEFTVEKPHFRTDQLTGLLKPETTLTVQVDGSKQHLRVLVPELDLAITTGESKQWSAHFFDLKAVHDHSSLLQQFKLDAGQVTISSLTGGAPYSFSADIPWQYPVLVSENKPIDHYRITGVAREGKLQADINKMVQLVYTDSFTINSKSVAYNVPALFKFIKECLLSRNDADNRKVIDVSLTATDSAFYLSSDSQLLADSIMLKSVNKKTNITLISGPGNIVIEMEGDRFSLKGEELHDTFMNGLSPDAQVRKGRMTMAAQGSFDEFSALIKVNDIVLENFKSLNNVLALMNTIPALITFNLPGYSSSGLSVTSAVAGMKVRQGLATLESMEIESPELSIAGKGWVNFPQKKVDMDLNLITQSKKNISKIPLVGYILTGKEKHPSITVKVSGDLLDPTVESQVFREVATMPFAVLSRTLALPGHLVSPMFNSHEGGQSEELGLEPEPK